MQSYPDIEIYLAHCDIARVDAWLQQAIAAEPLSPLGKRKWHTLGSAAADEIPVLVVEKAADGFTSLWFDSPATPWATDTECAQEAAARLGCEVRCSLGGWQPGDDPDRFLQVLPDGSEQPIDWPDSGQ
ncbi:hypothetical protein [Halomonas lysinitropha]|uniref:Uncharacterized protein n=1 Tax=Halomonas lysinitropha TaxID=2607506 RepID=A0A5K1I6J6_9GAMM|nr:hypothetical protein [Halomonas lysinitropha]VVZ95827.1 hypothetical protein HALO32_01907 [Halomonas lysinitropha]